MRYFSKELISSKLYLRCTGAPVPWINVGDDYGVYATDNQTIVDELDTAIKHSVGGVGMISAEDFEEAKKKATVTPSLSNLVRERWSLSGLSLPSLAGAAEAHSPKIHGQLPDVPKEQPSEPLKIQTEFVRPRTARGIFKEKSDAK